MSYQAINDKNISLILDKLPKRPFLAIFGTSHTCGDCDDKDSGVVEKTYGETLAKKLDLEYVNFGSSGAFNEDILQNVMFAVQHNLLHNCKLVLIEGRLGFGMNRLPKTSVVSSHDIIDFASNEKQSHIISETHYLKDEILYPCVDQLHYADLSWKLNLEYFKQDVLEYSPGKRFDVSDLEMKKLLDFAEKKVAYESHSSYNVHSDMIILNAIRLLLNSVGIENYWFNVIGHPVPYAEIDNLYTQNILFKNKTNIDFKKSDDAKNLSMFGKLKRMYGIDTIKQNFCSCSHGNEFVHELMAKLLLEKLNER